VRFTDPPAEADDLIAYEAKEASEKGESVVVVTADKDLAKKAKRSGAKVISTEDFYFEITRAPVHAHKEEHFTDEQLAELETAMMERASKSRRRKRRRSGRSPRSRGPTMPSPPRKNRPATCPRRVLPLLIRPRTKRSAGRATSRE